MSVALPWPKPLISCLGHCKSILTSLPFSLSMRSPTARDCSAQSTPLSHGLPCPPAFSAPATLTAFFIAWNKLDIYPSCFLGPACSSTINLLSLPLPPFRAHRPPSQEGLPCIPKGCPYFFTNSYSFLAFISPLP